MLRTKTAEALNMVANIAANTTFSRPFTPAKRKQGPSSGA